MNKSILSCGIVAMVVLNSVLSAQVVPFRASGSDSSYFPADGVYTGTGKATHMGRCQIEGVAFPIPTANPLVFDWIGGGSTTSANGDKIYMSGGGQVELIPLGGTLFSAVWSGHYSVDGGTGRFSNVGPGPAPIAVSAVNDPFDIASDPVWKFTWTLDGQIDLGRRR